MATKSVNADERLKRLADFVNEMQSVIAPTKNKTISIWVRLRSKDFGMSALNQSVIAPTIAECIVLIEDAITHHYNSVMATSFSNFEQVIRHSDEYDEDTLRDELQERLNKLQSEWTNLQESLDRMKKRDTLRKRRVKRAAKASIDPAEAHEFAEESNATSAQEVADAPNDTPHVQES